MEGSARNDRLHAQALVETADATTAGERLAHAFAGEWGASAGSIATSGATIDVQAWPDGLRLDAYADSEADLRAAERAIDEALARMSSGAADWRTRPSTIPGAPPLVPPVYTFPFDEDDD